MQVQDGVDRDRMRFRPLAHHLAMHLGFGRDIDHEIATDLGLAPKAPRLRQPAALLAVTILDGVAPRQVRGGRENPVLGEIADPDIDLAASADATPPAYAVEIDAQAAGRVQHRRALGETPPFAGRGKHDEEILHLGPALLRKLRSCLARGRRRNNAATPDRRVDPGSKTATRDIR